MGIEGERALHQFSTLYFLFHLQKHRELKPLVLFAAYYFIASYLIYRFAWLKLKGFKPFVTHFFFACKVLAGLVLWYIYTYQYTDRAHSDIFKFYDNALVLRQAAEENPQAFLAIFFNRNTDAKQQDVCNSYLQKMGSWDRNFDTAPINANRTMIRLQYIFLYCTFNTYAVHILFMCFISLVGWVWFYNAVITRLNVSGNIFTLLLLMLPSVLLWSNGILKECLMVAGMGLLFQAFMVNHTISKVAVAFAGLAVIAAVKFYAMLCFLPALCAYLVVKPDSFWLPALFRYVGIYLLLFVLALQLPRFNTKVDLLATLVDKQTNAIREARYHNAGSSILITPITKTASSVLKSIPSAIGNVFTRPYLSEARNMWMYASLLENILVLLIMLSSLLLRSREAYLPAGVFFLLIFVSVGYFALIGITTPVIGNLVRYKSVMMPLFLFPFVSLLNAEKVFNFLPFLGRLNIFCCGK